MATRLNTVQFACGNTVFGLGTVGKCWVFISGTWLDETADINSATTADVPMGGAVDDTIYFGFTDVIAGISFDTSTAPTGSVIWEYSKGGGVWAAYGSTALPTDNVTIGNEPPAAWAPDRVNGETDGPWYYLRCRRTAAGTGGTLSSASAMAAQRPANARSITIPDMAATPNVRHAVLRLIFGSSALESLERLMIRGRWDSTAYSNLIAYWNTTNNFTHGESWSHQCDIDITNITNTAWASGNTHTLDVMVGYCVRGAPLSDNYQWCSAELIITYDQDDTAATQIKTIVLPIDSLTGNLGTTQTTIGGAGAWPNLSALIPESSPSISDAYLQYIFNVNEADITDWSFCGQIDTETETLLATYDAANTSDFYAIVQWRRTDVSTTSSHDVKARVTSIWGALCSCIGVLLKVTYTHAAPSAGDTVLRQLVIPHEITTTFGGGPTVDNQTKHEISFWLEDTSLALVRAGSLVYTHQAAAAGALSYACGSQTARSYTFSADQTVGPTPLVHRFDSGALAGLGITLTRGKNTLTITNRYATTPANAGGMSAETYILYSCRHNASKRTSCALLPLAAAGASSNWANTLRRTFTFRWPIPEPNWFISACGAIIVANGGDAYATAVLRIQKAVQEGWLSMGGLLTGIDAFLGIRIACTQLCPLVKHYPGQPSDQYRCDPVATTTSATLDTPNDRLAGALAWVTWHDYLVSTDLTISGSSGGTVDVEVRDKLDGTKLVTGSRVGDGTLTVSWYDNTRDVIATATESTTKSGQTLAFKFGD